MAWMVNLVMMMIPPKDDDNNDKDKVKEDEEDDKDNDEDVGEQHGHHPVNLSFGDISDFTMESEPSTVATTMKTSITAALVSEASRGGKKQSRAPKGWGGGQKRRTGQ